MKLKLSKLVVLIAFLSACGGSASNEEPLPGRKPGVGVPTRESDDPVELLSYGDAPRKLLRLNLLSGRDEVAVLALDLAASVSFSGIKTNDVDFSPLSVTTKIAVDGTDEWGAATLLVRVTGAELRNNGLANSPIDAEIKEHIKKLSKLKCSFVLTSRGISRSEECNHSPDAMHLFSQIPQMTLSTLRDSLPVFPAQPVGVGARWKATRPSFAWEAARFGEKEYTYEVTAVHGNAVELKVEFEKVSQDQSLPSGGSTKVGLKSDTRAGEATLLFDLMHLLPASKSFLGVRRSIELKNKTEPLSSPVTASMRFEGESSLSRSAAPSESAG